MKSKSIKSAGAAVRAAVVAAVMFAALPLMGCPAGHVVDPPQPPTYGQLVLDVNGVPVTMDLAFVGTGTVNGEQIWHLGGGIGNESDPDFSASSFGTLVAGDYVFGGLGTTGTDHAEFIENEIGFRTDETHVLTLHVTNVDAKKVTGTITGQLHQDNTYDPEVVYTVQGSFELPIHRN